MERETTIYSFSKRADLIEKLHKSSRHLGTKASIDFIMGKCWWPTMKQDITDWIQRCKDVF